MPVRDHQLRASLQLKGGLRHCPAEGGTFWASLSAIKRCYDWCLCRAHRCLQIRDLSTTSQCGSSFSCWIERDLGISQGSASLPILRVYIYIYIIYISYTYIICPENFQRISMSSVTSSRADEHLCARTWWPCTCPTCAKQNDQRELLMLGQVISMIDSYELTINYHH